MYLLDCKNPVQIWTAKIRMTTWRKRNEFSVEWISAAKIDTPILFFIKEWNFLKASL